MARSSQSASVASMSIKALFKLRDEVAEAIANRTVELRRQLEQLTGIKTPGRKPGRTGRKGKQVARTGRKGKKVAPQVRSKKNQKEGWSGRGITPRWMREEMKGTRFTKESFRIQ